MDQPSRGTDARPESTLSKNQLKKLRKRQEWEAQRETRKQRRKEKKVAQRERRQQAAPDPATPAAAATTPLPRPAPRRAPSVQLPVTIVLDCGFDALMTDKERISLASQVTRCYADNARAPYRAHLALAAFGGRLRERFDTVLAGHHRGWKGVRFDERDFAAVAAASKAWMADPKTGGQRKGAFAPPPDAAAAAAADPAGPETFEDAETVYLTSESPAVLTRLRPGGTYVVGALVDRNRHKGVCYRRAVAAAGGVRTARLPIAEHMDMASRVVLTTNHVHEILLAWLATGDWAAALARVMPKRKGAVLKGGGQEEGSLEGQAEEQEEREEGDADEGGPDGQSNGPAGTTVGANSGTVASDRTAHADDEADRLPREPQPVLEEETLQERSTWLE